MKKGPKETALQEMREAACKIDHDRDLPKFLCVKCNPRKPETGTAAPTVPQETKRDFQIPKGMSTEDGKAMLAERAAKKAEIKKQAIESLTTKQRDELARINALRETNGLPPLPEKYYQRQMKADPATNEMLFARAELKPKPKSKMETDMTTTAKKPTAAKKPAAAAKPKTTERRKTKPAAAREAPVAKAKKTGAFNPAVTDMVMGMIKKGTTAKAIIAAAKWSDCPNPMKRVNRFVTDVAEAQHKLKVEITGRGEDATYELKK